MSTLIRAARALRGTPLFALAVLPLVAPACTADAGATLDRSVESEAPIDGHRYEIASIASALVLDVVGASSADGAEVQQFTNGARPNQQWTPRRQSDGSFTLENAASGKCLDVWSTGANGAHVQQWSCGSGANQRWWLRAVGDGGYEIVSAQSGKCLDVTGASRASGARLQQWECYGGANQKWRFSSVGAPVSPGPTCSDTPPDGSYSCAQQRDWGKCGEPWMVGHCDATCGRCGKTGGGTGSGGGTCAADACPAPHGGLTTQCEKRFAYGANWAWNHFGGDFGGIPEWNQNGVSLSPDDYDAGLAKMESAGVGVTRWWMFPTFVSSGVHFGADGAPSGISDVVVADVQKALELADKHQVHVMFTLFSFDNFRPTKTEYGIYQRGMRAMVVDASKRKNLIDNLVRPLARAVAASPYKHRVLAWDIINEPEWALAGASLYGDPGFDPMGGLETITHAEMETFVREVAAALHDEHSAPVTVGSAGIKWGKAWTRAGLDFYQLHYYDWVYEWYPYGSVTPASIGLDKPVIMGEFPFQGVSAIASKGLPARTFSELSSDLWSLGYAGALGWAMTDASFPWNAGEIRKLADAHSCETRY